MVSRRFWDYFVPALAAAGLVLGGAFHVFGPESWGHWTWFVTLALGALPLTWRTLREISHGKFGVDLIAIVAIFASFWAGEYLAGVVILLMLSGGEALEAYAQARAQRELTALLSQAPSVAHRKAGDKLVDIGVDEARVGDLLVIKPGEVVPTDGVVALGSSNLDEAVITGESLPVEKRPGSLVYSGSVNEDRFLEVRVTRSSGESKYQTIVRLVREAQESQAPVVRLADRYALAFNLGTFAFALLTWVLFRDPTRVLAVLVVASPCPLILATPIAMISGISRAASRGIVVKNGSALERLGMVRGLVFDKTGTLTLGTPEVVEAVSTSDLSADEVLRLAVSIDQLSAHVFARSLVRHAHRHDLELDYPEKFEEVFGQGVGAELGGQPYLFGKLKFLAEQGVTVSPEAAAAHEKFQAAGQTAAYLATGGRLVGYVVFADVVRPETKGLFAEIREHKVPRLVMLTGDKRAVAESIAQAVGIDEFHAELLPEQKVEWLKRIQAEAGPMAMVGDGVNDAPALAAASVGIAMASHGATAASETGDVVIMVNDMGRVHDALHLAQGALRLAKQGIFFGMGASLVLMVLALLGYVAPVFGAVIQEVLDVLVILNALRLNFEKVK